MLQIAIPQPTMEEFKNSAEKFSHKWNYPNAVGAIDGKHIRIKCPAKSGSLYFNYKEYFSIVLLAIVNADYKFLAIDVGSYGREGDAGMYAKEYKCIKILKKNKFHRYIFKEHIWTTD